jgi:hypothetical protein
VQSEGKPLLTLWSPGTKVALHNCPVLWPGALMLCIDQPLSGPSSAGNAHMCTSACVCTGHTPAHVHM